ncbi:MAG: RecX family transcriptional regulator [Chloroflexota bacterium]
MATITAIETQKRRPDRVNIELDGEFAFGLAGILAAGLKVGQHLEPERIAALQARDADESAYQQALRLLSLRERSESELRTYLRKRKTPEDVTERTLVRLREHRHADDAHFARSWVENRSTFRPRGRRALAWELRRKGVAADVAETVLSDIDESTLAHQAGLKKAGQLSSADWQDFRTKVSAYLARRGFATPIITSTVSRLWAETHAGQPSLQEEDIS